MIDRQHLQMALKLSNDLEALRMELEALQLSDQVQIHFGRAAYPKLPAYTWEFACRDNDKPDERRRAFADLKGVARAFISAQIADIELRLQNLGVKV